MANTNCFLDYAGLELFWSKVKDVIENNELVTANAITNLDTRVGNLESTKSDVGHTHDDRYYTESEINNLLGTKSDTNHTHTFASLTSKPTTISGYGITDALTTSNYTSYTVKKDGTGASGTWGISISGNAATATNADYATSAGSAPASDVYSWAKQSTKPSYSLSEITPGIATIGDGANRLMFRTNSAYKNGIYYSTPENEALVFGTVNPITSWIFATTDPTTQTAWTSLTPSLQIKNGRVVINKLIASNTEASYNLDVNGSANATTLYENGVRVSVNGHTHDDRYYTESEVDTKLATKSDTGHTHTKSQITDFPTSLPASDVYSWAKQSTKPSYSFSEITSKPTTLAGYGITDAASKDHTHTDKLNKIIETTYSNLVTLKNSASLVPGQQYRITDYTCTTTQEGTKAENHTFDIIVTADSESTLNEEARAVQHVGDSYFTNCDLNAWKIWYCLDNDSARFAWADSTNGKGVIYRMIDEFNNDVPYDFKNIMFKDPNSPGNNFYYYTFSGDGGEETDYSILRTTNIFSNTISPFYGSNLTNSKQTINKILFSVGGDGNCYGNYFGSGCYNITLSFYCCNNTFGNGCYSNSLSPHCSNNTFGDNCNSNTFGNSCSNNTVGNGCYSNTFDSYCSSNIFGIECHNNTVGMEFSNNTFGNSCSNNTTDIDFMRNTFGDSCSNNSFGSEIFNNTFGPNCSYNTFGGSCSGNTFGSTCRYIKFASDSSASTKYDLYRYNRFGDGCRYILFKEAGVPESSATQVQNYNFAQGLQGTSSTYLTVNGERSRSYETKVAKNSNGELKIYCEADLIQ